MSLDDSRYIDENVKKDLFPKESIHFIDQNNKKEPTEEQKEMMRRISPQTCHSYAYEVKRPVEQDKPVYNDVDAPTSASHSIVMNNSKSYASRVIDIVKFMHGETGYSYERTLKRYKYVLGYFGTDRSIRRIEEVMLKISSSKHKDKYGSMPVDSGIRIVIDDLEDTFAMKFSHKIF